MKLKFLFYALVTALLLSGCNVSKPYGFYETDADEIVSETLTEQGKTDLPDVQREGYFDYAEVPEFDGGEPYAVVNENVPFFTESQLTTVPFESYGELDELGRCTTVCANVGKELMPTEERGSIGSVKPSGWQTAKYDNVDGKYLYNRCHLIGYQLTGENANVQNLITGTRYMNVQGMLPFEDMVADYVKETNNHVLYRVTPIFRGNELVARGVLMEAYSVEDDGDGICFNVFCYNVQPDIDIDYLTGESRYVDNKSDDAEKAEYVLNTSSKKFHYAYCSSVNAIKDKNRKDYKGDRDSLIDDGYSPCGSCRP